MTAYLEGSQLFVNDRPFVVLGAEIHNSSSSTVEAIAASFARVREIGANTVLAPVAWDLLEPAEGVFDYSLVDAMLVAARRERLQLIPLWFGAWKNGQSTYAPSWVKTDTDRFPRARLTGHGAVEHVTPFGSEIAAADAAAFRALMAHFQAVSAGDTIVMVQVENEVGLLGDSRDRSPHADRAWADHVPATVIDAISSAPHMPVRSDWIAGGSKAAGTWSEVLGDAPTAHEAFMARAYARHIEEVAAAGREQFDVPLFVNAWLNNPPGIDFVAEPTEETESDVVMAGGARPGTYPSGGPLPRVAPIWTATAPTLDLLAPDIYFGDPDTIFSDFRAVAGRLLIPEMRRSDIGVGHMFLAVGEYNALGVSPFGVDSLDPGDSDERVLIDAYSLLADGIALRQAARGSTSRGFNLNTPDDTTTFTCGSYTVTVDCRDPFGIFEPTLPAYGMLILGDDGQFTAIGRGFRLSFDSTTGSKVGILSADELARDAGGLVRVVRRWNGDETAGGSIRIPPLKTGQAAPTPIPVMTSSTGIVKFSLYSYGD